MPSVDIPNVVLPQWAKRQNENMSKVLRTYPTYKEHEQSSQNTSNFPRIHRTFSELSQDIMLTDIMLGVIMLSAIMLDVLAPSENLLISFTKRNFDYSEGRCQSYKTFWK
jgi:hypothetical protein